MPHHSFYLMPPMSTMDEVGASPNSMIQVCTVEIPENADRALVDRAVREASRCANIGSAEAVFRTEFERLHSEQVLAELNQLLTMVNQVAGLPIDMVPARTWSVNTIRDMIGEGWAANQTATAVDRAAQDAIHRYYAMYGGTLTGANPRISVKLPRLVREYKRYGARAAKELMQQNLISWLTIGYGGILVDPEEYPHPEWHKRGHEIRTCFNTNPERAAGMMIELTVVRGVAMPTQATIAIAKKLGVSVDAFTERVNAIASKQASFDKELAWADQGWWLKHKKKLPFHYVHVSKDDDTKIAYYDSYEKLYRGVATRTRPGRYLTKFAAELLESAEIKLWAERQQVFAESRRGALHFVGHDDEKGWIEVYETGPHSCMKGDTSVRVYAHENSVLRLAYWTQDGKIQARCIVREDEKQWIRVYPDPENDKYGRALVDELEKLGYEWGSFEGVRIQAIERGGYNDMYVCPYIDYGTANTMNAELNTYKRKNYLMLSENADYDAQNTSGWISLSHDCCDDDDENMAQCEECGCAVHIDDAYGSDRYNNTYCGECWDRYFRQAYNSASRLLQMERIHRDDCVQVGGEFYEYDSEILNAHDIYECEKCGNWHHEADLRKVPSEEDICKNCVSKLDIPHIVNDEEYYYARSEHTKKISNGCTVHRSYKHDEERPEPEQPLPKIGRFKHWQPTVAFPNVCITAPEEERAAP